jgi:hypothetical protein
MSGISDPTCVLCGTALERVRYFSGKLIAADDMRAEQEFMLNKMRRHNRFLHGWGVVCGCEVVPMPTEKNPWQVQVCPGYAVAPQGDEIFICESETFDLQTSPQARDPGTMTWSCPPVPAKLAANDLVTVYMAIRYLECATRPVPMYLAGWGDDELECEYSRTRETHELKLLWSLPASHAEARKADAAWADEARAGIHQARQEGVPVPSCPACTDEPWVVLATIRLPNVQGLPAGGDPQQPPITAGDISFLDRRVLYSVTALQVMLGETI